VLSYKTPNFLFRAGSFLPKRGNSCLRGGNLLLKRGNSYLGEGNLLLKRGKSYLREGSSYLKDAKPSVKGGSYYLYSGNSVNSIIPVSFSKFTSMSLPADVKAKIIQCLMGLNVYKIILFGSYANNTATEDSDIDLVVILDTEDFAKTFDERMDRRRPVSRALLEINRRYAMDIIVYSKGEFEYLDRKESDFVREIRSNGKEIYAK
jgi:predicted nucleotidyltransferase